jgi:hypothetical protein
MLNSYPGTKSLLNYKPLSVEKNIKGFLFAKKHQEIFGVLFEGDFDNQIQTIYVFYGRKDKKVSQEQLIKNIFSDKENDEIQKNKSKIIFCSQRIHPDDSILTIKIKIINELIKKNVSIDELYLFCKKRGTKCCPINPVAPVTITVLLDDEESIFSLVDNKTFLFMNFLI